MARQLSRSTQPLSTWPAARWPLSDDFDRFFSRMMPRAWSELEDEGHLAGWRPAVDVKETEKEYVVSADIPGIDPKEIEVTMEKDVLTIKGERNMESRDEKEGYRCVERFEGSFFRRIMLPDADDANKVTATNKHGVLEIRVPKAKGHAAHRIPIK